MKDKREVYITSQTAAFHKAPTMLDMVSGTPRTHSQDAHKVLQHQGLFSFSDEAVKAREAAPEIRCI